MRRHWFLALIILGLFSPSGQPAPMTPKHLTDAEKQRISEAGKAYAKGVLAMDVSAATAVFTEDAIFLDPSSPMIRGKTEIRKFFQTLFARQVITAFSVTPVEVFGVDGLAYEVGSWSLTMKSPESNRPLSESGSYVFALKKQPDGSWKIAVDIGNTSPPRSVP